MTPPRSGWRLPFALAGVYVATTLLTRALFQGDTADYVAEAARPWGPADDFGHLLWVPTGRAVAEVIRPAVEMTWGEDPRAPLVFAFLGLNWLAGLACVLPDIAVRLGAGVWAAGGAALGMLFSQAFLNFAQTGSSYVPGLAFVVLALWLAVAVSGSVWGALSAGAAFALAVCLWFPFVLIGPAVALAPRLLRPDQPHRLRFGLILAAAAGLTLALIYGTAALALGITDLGGLRAWMSRSAHGVRTGGVARAALGLARSFIHLGEDGLLFKRWLLRDPYNPVGLGELTRLSLWKIGFFYASLAAALVAARRGLPLLLIAAVPVVGFGVYWQGGDMERYLPLFPFLFLALAAAWSAPGWAKWLPAAFFICAAVANGVSHSRWGAADTEARTRVEGLTGLPDGSRIYVVKDRLTLLPREALLEPKLRRLPVIEAVIPGKEDAPQWRALFTLGVRAAWSVGGEVWLSRHLLADTPHPSGGWAEGDDPRVKWADLPAFFRRFEVDSDRGGEDGFVRLAASERNRRLLDEVPTP
jgi:hypothetical protein